MKVRLAVLLVLAGCSPPPDMTPPDSGAMDSGVPDAGPPLSWLDACTAYVTPYCNAWQQCEPEYFGWNHASVASCVQHEAANCVEERTAPGTTATPAMLAACTSAIGDFTCDVFYDQYDFGLSRLDPQCQFTGTLPDGTACIDDGQCVGGACSKKFQDSCGTCVTPASNQACISGVECAGKTYCEYNRCVGLGELGAPCDDVDPCRSTLVCSGGTCQQRKPEGAPCDVAVADCNLFLRCTAAGCQRAMPATSGACGTLGDGSVVACTSGTVCKYQQSLGYDECVSTSGAGSPCTGGYDCDEGLRCYEGSCARLSASRCVPPDGGNASSTYPARVPDAPRLVGHGATPVVIASPKIVAVTFTQDSTAEQLEQFVAGLAGSPAWHAATAEYGIGPLTALPPIRASDPPLSPVSDAQLRTWLAGKIAGGAPWPAADGSTLFMLFMPPGWTVNQGSGASAQTSCTDFFGYHSSFIVNGVRVLYAIVDKCVLTLPTPTAVHEAAEAMTDPYYDADAGYYVGYNLVDTDHLAWGTLDPGQEVGDLCDAIPYSRPPYAAVDGGQIQRTWSNASIAAFHTPCVPAMDGQPFFAAVPDTPDTVSMALSSSTQPTKGISIAVGGVRTVNVDLLSDSAVDGPWRVTAYDIDWWKGYDPALSFSFDRQFGVNGDHLQMTIKVLYQSGTYKSEPFIVISRRGRTTHYWLGVVGNP